MQDITEYGNNSAMHYELKVQYAWEYISSKYGKHYADDCILVSGIKTHARNHPGLTVAELAKFAMGKAAGTSA